MSKKILVLLMFFIFLPGLAQAKNDKQVNTVEDFFSHPKFQQIVISPDGEHFAVTYKKDTEVRLAIVDRESKKVISGFDYGEYRRIQNVRWVSNERVVFSVVKFVGLWDNKGGPPSIMAVNIDGSRRVNLTKKAGGFSVISYLNDNPEEILVQKGRYDGGEYKAKMHYLNVKKGTLRYFADQPEKAVQTYIADRQGVPRVAVRYEVDRKSNEIEPAIEIFYKDSGGQWNSFDVDSEVEKPRFDFVGMSGDKMKYYFSSDYDDPDKRLMGLHELDLRTKKVKLLKRHDYVDIVGGMSSPDGALVAYSYDDGYYRREYIDKKDWYAQIMLAFEASFPDSVVSITSMTADKNEAVVSVSSDQNPGEFYIFDRAKRKVSFYGASKPSINKKLLGQMNPIHLKARDGVDLHGYLTLPKGSKGKNLPTIVMIHGGPHGPRDGWGWNSEAQFLAANGYAVVQINFRGSGGYGKTFERSGYLKWGAEMQDDVTDATLWAIKQGIADKDRICVYGGSYGGYASAMAVVREPDLYKCSLPYVGVYSLPVMKTAGDIPRSKGGRDYLDRVLGEDKADMSARSPADNVSRIKADLFIAHGEADERCPMEQYDALTDALDKAGIKYQSMLRDEGHGYQIEKNRYDFYSAMLKFFNKNLM